VASISDASSPGAAGSGTDARDSDSPVRPLLAVAVSAIGGTERPGQTVMAQAVWDAVAEGTHLAVQAGTGTGKSLAYLVPALRLAADKRGPVVVSTATIALQRQLVDRDLPRLAQALREPLGRTPEFAILKGRNNYLCLNKLRNGPDDEQDSLFDALGSREPASQLGQHVKRLHSWAASTTTGDRDELVPGVPDQAWRQVAVTARECLGVNRCAFGIECFSERARRTAAESDVIVTNHALLAIDTLGEGGILPEHRVVIIDEAHELVDRVTSVATGELSANAVDFAVRRTGRLADENEVARLSEAGNALGPLLTTMPAGRMDTLDQALAATLAALRDAATACSAQVRKIATNKDDDADPAEVTAAQAATTVLEEIEHVADRMIDAFELPIAEREEVVWLERPEDWLAESTRPPSLHVAPLDVGEMLAEHLFSDATVVLTSATLTLGGSFAPLARQWGLDASAHGSEWTGIDVGSPFAHGRSGILYVARHLPPPTRDGLPPEYLDELWELIKAAGGRTLGLFSSMRAAKAAAATMRESLPYPVLCQGDDSTMQLVKEFAADEPTCLFGTLSLWQGVDVPGPSLRLVVIDRIPFPRPDDPLGSARSRAADARGGSGFMEVSANHAALLLAQGAGRLLRAMDDRGVVAVLDSRLVTKRYGEYLRASLPPFWQTTDPAVVRGALERLRGQG
jgi:ATP-dependent DNA helicase DinG